MELASARPSLYLWEQSGGTCPALHRTEESPGASILWPCTLRPQELSQVFFHASRKFFASPCLYLSGAFQKKSKQEFHLSRDTHSPGPGAFCQSGAQHLETRRGGGGCGHRAAYEGVPLALHSCGAPAVVAGGGLTLVNRAALPPAPSSPPAAAHRPHPP